MAQLCRHPVTFGFIVVCAGAALLLALLGCNETRRYRTLSFFFDGVPLPASMLPPSATQPGEGQGESREPAVTYYHRPYQEHNCTGCHNPEVGFSKSVDDPQLCRRCHETHYDAAPGDWMHGPTAKVMCRYCHEAHKSENPKLLTRPQPNLCFDCHEEQRVRQDPFHAANIEAKTCGDCHDPHAAGNRFLLADARTYRRRYRAAEVLTTPHDDWSKDTCNNCHDMDHSMKLRDGINQQCLQCHTKIQEPPESPAVGTLHKAVVDAACISCHTPHRSTRPHLVRGNGEQICVTCHKLAELPSIPHKNMVRVDCLICHTGHHAPDPKLLRPHVMQTLAPMEDGP